MRIKFPNKDATYRAVRILTEIYKGVEPIKNNNDGTFTVIVSAWDTLKYLGYQFDDVIEDI